MTTFLVGRRRMLVYLARYLRQDLDALERRPIDVINLDHDLVSELVKAENATSTPTGAHQNR